MRMVAFDGVCHVTSRLHVTQGLRKVEDVDLGWGEEADRQPAGPDAARDEQVPAVLDDVPARVALAVVGGQQSGGAGAGSRPVRRACGPESVSETRSGTPGNRSGSCESIITGASVGTSRSALPMSGRRWRRSAEPGDPEHRRRSTARSSSTVIPTASSARHIRSPELRQSWLPITATVPSGDAQPRELLGDPLGRELAPPASGSRRGSRRAAGARPARAR